MKKKIMVAMPDRMVEALEREQKKRLLDSKPETIRSILGEYFKSNNESDE